MVAVFGGELRARALEQLVSAVHKRREGFVLPNGACVSGATSLWFGRAPLINQALVDPPITI